MCTSEADFHKPGIYGGSARVWATACDVFCRAPSRVGRGRRAAVDFVVCFGWGGYFFVFFRFYLFVFLRTHTACCKYEAASCLIYLSTSNEASPRERSDRGRFLHLGKKPLHTGVRTGCHYLTCLCVVTVYRLPIRLPAKSALT